MKNDLQLRNVTPSHILFLQFIGLLIFLQNLMLIQVVTFPPDGSMGSFPPCLLGDGLGENRKGGSPVPVRGG